MTSNENPIIRFHPYYGDNILLSKDNTVAYREKDFAKAVTFSERPLEPGEIFLLEIEEVERGWSGHMRLGLIQLDPRIIYRTGSIPQYSLPDLRNRGKSWIYGISKADNNKDYNENGQKRVIEVFKTCRGFVPTSLLKPVRSASKVILPTGIGSRIGVMYVPTSDLEADMHYIINGEDQGARVKHIPYMEAPLHVVVDVYGTTKKVRIIQLIVNRVPSLQYSCRNAILQHITEEAVSSLPLPNLLKQYLLYQA